MKYIEEINRKDGYVVKLYKVNDKEFEVNEENKKHYNV